MNKTKEKKEEAPYEIIAWTKGPKFAHADVYVPSRISEHELTRIADKIKADCTFPIEEAMLDFHLVKNPNTPAYGHSNFKKEKSQPDFEATFICGISKEKYDKWIPKFKTEKRDIFGVWLDQTEFITVYKDKGSFFIERLNYASFEDKLFQLELAEIALIDLPLGAKKISYLSTDTVISYWGSIMGYPATKQTFTHVDNYIIDSNGQMAYMDNDVPFYLEKIR